MAEDHDTRSIDEIVEGFAKLASLQRQLADAYSGQGDSLNAAAAARARAAAAAWETAQMILTSPDPVGRAIDDEAFELADRLIEARFGPELYESSLALHPDAAALVRAMIVEWDEPGPELLATAERMQVQTTP